MTRDGMKKDAMTPPGSGTELPAARSAQDDPATEALDAALDSALAELAQAEPAPLSPALRARMLADAASVLGTGRAIERSAPSAGGRPDMRAGGDWRPASRLRGAALRWAPTAAFAASALMGLFLGYSGTGAVSQGFASALNGGDVYQTAFLEMDLAAEPALVSVVEAAAEEQP